MATDIRSASSGFASSWRELARMPTYQVPVVLGGFLAAFVGILTYALDVVQASAIVAASASVVYLIIFRLIAPLGQRVADQQQLQD